MGEPIKAHPFLVSTSISFPKKPYNWIGISKNSYITKPTMMEYFEMSSSYRTYKNNR